MLKFLKDESGQGMVEYGLIIGLVAVVLIGALTALAGGGEEGGGLKGLFGDVTDKLNVTDSESPALPS